MTNKRHNKPNKIAVCHTCVTLKYYEKKNVLVLKNNVHDKNKLMVNYVASKYSAVSIDHNNYVERIFYSDLVICLKLARIHKRLVPIIIYFIIIK